MASTLLHRAPAPGGCCRAERYVEPALLRELSKETAGALGVARAGGGAPIALTVWANGKVLRRLPGHPNDLAALRESRAAIYHVAFSPDGKTLATGEADHGNAPVTALLVHALRDSFARACETAIRPAG